jgi:hypothetical protein
MLGRLSRVVFLIQKKFDENNQANIAHNIKEKFFQHFYNFLSKSVSKARGLNLGLEGMQHP